jgi:hypothetical protein
VLARDGYAPKSLNTRGDRLVYSNGMILLGIAALAVLLIFQADLTTLIQLYIIGVFVSFSLGQIGMVRHWNRELRLIPRSATLERHAALRGRVVNSLGAVMTVVVLVIVTVTKFTHGAWLIFLAIPVLTALMMGVRRYYLHVEEETAIDDSVHFGSRGDVALVLVGSLHKPAAKAIDYALAARHDTTIAVHVSVTPRDTAQLEADWEEHHVPVPLVILESPYRQYAGPLAAFIGEYRKKHGSSVVTIYLPQYIVGHWWESFLHNRRARRLTQRLMLVHGVVVTLVPWMLDSSRLLYRRAARPLPGDDRAGLPATYGLVAHLAPAADAEPPDPVPPGPLPPERRSPAG